MNEIQDHPDEQDPRLAQLSEAQASQLDNPPSDEEMEQAKESGEAGDVSKAKQRGKYILVRYGKMNSLGLFRHNEKQLPPSARYVIVQTERGIELGEIVSVFFHHRGTCDLTPEEIEAYCRKSGENYPLMNKGRFIRFASEQDLNEQRHLKVQAKSEWDYCAELIARHELPMQLVEVEHLFGGDRIIYYFMSDGRVDFRQLVKDLAQQYQTRIEMRQVGARDEARIVADFETCGRECCCKNFLKVLQPVNMRMAKLQKATLDPSKISGRCGRLKCCLRYEDDVYTELKRSLPRNNAVVLTDKGPGIVLETQVLTQLVKVRLDNGSIIALRVDEIRDKRYQRPADGSAPPTPAVPMTRSPTAPDADDDLDDNLRDEDTAARENTALAAEEEEISAAAPAPEAASEPGQKKKRRRRKRRKRKPADGAAPSSPPPAS